MEDTLRGKRFKSRFILSAFDVALADNAYIEVTFDVRKEWVAIPVISGAYNPITANSAVEFVLTLTQGGDTETFYYLLKENVALDPKLICEGKRDLSIRMYNRTGNVSSMRMSVDLYLYCNE